METLLGIGYNVWWFLVFGAVISVMPSWMASILALEHCIYSHPIGWHVPHILLMGI